MLFPTATVTAEPVSSDRQVRIEVVVIEQFTEHNPARLRIEFTNEASTQRDFLFGICPPFGALMSDAEDAGTLHVVPDDDTVPGAGFYRDVVPSTPIEECWQLNYRPDHIDRGLLWPADPGATTALTYAVLNDTEADDCLPPGVYRFEAKWGERFGRHEESREAWSFTLVLE